MLARAAKGFVAEGCPGVPKPSAVPESDGSNPWRASESTLGNEELAFPESASMPICVVLGVTDLGAIRAAARAWLMGSGALLVGISRAMVPRSSQFRARHLADTGAPFGVRAATWHQAARRYTVTKMSTQASREIQTFPNPNPGRDFEIQCVCPEFTNVCPMTGQPDFATITITYVPDQRCIELKSLKLYLWTYRDEGGFHEAVTNQIADDLIAALDPRRITVVGAFNVRGGITTTVTVTHHKG